jgi:hypothetical protein
MMTKTLGYKSWNKESNRTQNTTHLKKNREEHKINYTRLPEWRTKSKGMKESR